jgi:hypothetical protein
VPPREAHSARDDFESLPSPLRDAARAIARAYGEIAQEAERAVRRSTLLSDVDALQLVRAFKGARAALRFRRYQFWEAHEIADEDRLLGVRRAGESEEWIVEPENAKAVFESWADEIERRLDLVTFDTPTEDGAVMSRTPPGPSIKLFISHSSDDGELAGRVAELLRASLNLSAALIRCTSVDGFRLPGGADTDEQLRNEVHDAEAFIGIVSDRSVRSMYVLFELGARWGAGRHLLPLLAHGTPPSVMGGPLAGLNALRADNRAQLLQLVSDVARILGLRPEDGATYQEHIERVLQLPQPPTASTAPPVTRTPAEPSAMPRGPHGWMAN